MAYRTRNVAFEARLLYYMAYGTRNIIFEARLKAFRARTVSELERRDRRRKGELATFAFIDDSPSRPGKTKL